MNQQSEHLSNAQIEDYGKRPSGSGPDQSEAVDEHLAGCSSCRSRLLDFQRTQLALLADPQQFAGSNQLADPKVNTASTPECPGKDDLHRLAASLCSDDLAGKLIQHAVACDHCGPLLRIYTEDFSDDFTPEQQAAMADLKSASPAWQSQTARQMLAAAAPVAAADISTEGTGAAADAGTGAAASADRKSSESFGRKIFPWRWVLVPAAAAACALVAFGVWYSQRETPEKVEKLLAQAYTEQRTMEMRIPYARHSDFHQLRSGDSGSLLSSPESLRKATDEIATQLKKNPADPKWLLLSARLDLLDWHYKAALSTLDKIKDEKISGSSEMSMVRVLALYEQAEFEPDGRDQAYGEIVNLTGKTLQKNPDDRVTLFNQAIACEKLHMYECAISDYEHLLSLEKDSGWVAEASRRLSEIQEKKTHSP